MLLLLLLTHSLLAAANHVLREEDADLDLLTPVHAPTTPHLNIRLPDDFFDKLQSVSHSPGGAVEGNTALIARGHLVVGIGPHLSARLRLDAFDGAVGKAANHPGPLHLFSATAAAAAAAATVANTAAATAAATSIGGVVRAVALRRARVFALVPLRHHDLRLLLLLHQGVLLLLLLLLLLTI
jgi:hypothetical protein